MAPPERLVELRFPSRADRLRMVRCMVQGAAELSGCGPQQADELVLAVNEACMNVIQHAYGDGQPGEIILEIIVRDGSLVFRLSDFAEPVEPAKLRSRDLEDIRPGGLGIHFIREVMDTAGFVAAPEGVGNVFEMTKAIEPQEEHGDGH